jgi:CPA1 family monovalent cation:H+ antiporter
VEVLSEVVGSVTIIVVVAALARRFGLLAPIVLVVAGLGLSFVPGVPSVHLDPEIVLIGILPPLLYVAAMETSVPDFRYNMRGILLLAIGLVIFTALAVGFVVHAVLPGVPLAACLALGAVVAPPDAIAATAVARRIGLPRRIVTILEGESLINDASALVLFRLTVAAAIGSAVGVSHIALDALVSVGGGLAVGAVGAIVFSFIHRRVTEPLLDNALSLLAPFLVVLAAETINASSVVAVVVTGLVLGNRLSTLMSAGSRLQMEAFWKMVKFLLEGLVFLLVGLQLRQILKDLKAPTHTVVWVTVAVVLTVILARVIWIYPATYLPRFIPAIRRRDPFPPITYPTVIAWAGMRGVVTLATALALPSTLAGGRAYPHDLFVWIAFAVIIVTLVLQGTSLPLVARTLRLRPDDPMADTLAEAAVQHEASRAGLRALEEHSNGAPTDVVERLRNLAEHRSNKAWERLGASRRETPSQAYVRLRRAMLNAEREVFRNARDSGRVPEEVMRRTQRDMDLEESLMQRTAEAPAQSDPVDLG